MLSRRLGPLALAVTAALAVVALAAHGRPLRSGGGVGGGLPATFWDYVFTTLLIVEALLALAALAALVLFRRPGAAQRQPYQRRTLRALATLLIVAVLVTLIGRHLDLHRLLHPHGTGTPAVHVPTGPTARSGRAATQRHVEFRWDELAIVLGLLLAFAAAVAVSRARRRPAAPTRPPGRAALSAALDESLDDLRADPDLRRAIVAAYARMETALAAAGLARRPAEAPLEFLERALLGLEASAGAVRRLTELFEWARFSQHEPEPWMRDAAVDALVTVRDELRGREPVAT